MAARHSEIELPRAGREFRAIVNAPTPPDSPGLSLREDPPRKTKTVGRRLREPGTPAENYARAAILQRAVDRLNPFPKPRGFVHRARSWEDFERWRNAHENPRLWRRQ